MKKFICFLSVFLITILVYSQPIIYKDGEIKDLKDCVTKYTIVSMTVGLAANFATAGTDDGKTWFFSDKENGKKKKFETFVELLNYMAKFGWKYVDRAEDPYTGKPAFLFEKKEN